MAARAQARTSGHHPPVYELLKPYSEFPDSVSGPTVWKASDYVNSPEKWVHKFTPDEVADLGRAADAFAAKKLALTDIQKEDFRLSPAFESFLANVRKDLIDGKGFVLFKGFPTTEWPLEKVATAYMGLGAHIGEFVSQNGKGHVLVSPSLLAKTSFISSDQGHVKDLGNDPTAIDKVRIYSTNAKQFFHVDTCDVVGLLCLHKAKEGGESDIVSSHHLYNILKKEHPDVLETLTKPIWYWDRKGEVSDGQKPYFRAAVYYYYQGRVILHFDPYYVRSLKRFWDTGELPPLSPEQTKAIQVLEDVATREALHMILDIGDVQFVSCNHVLHARTAYVDHAPPTPRRQLMRLWLATSEEDGGWPIPFPDSKERRRGGITVNYGPHTSPLDAE